MLHITNGDSAAERIQAAGITDPIVAWADVLHDGPVPGGLVLPELSRVRARYIADAFGGEYEEILNGFSKRDVMVLSAREIALWFEHDLYDQLRYSTPSAITEPGLSSSAAIGISGARRSRRSPTYGCAALP